jgi:hypothetical protein
MVIKISKKLFKVDESFTVHMYDNGYMFEIGGRDREDEWASAKIMCASIDEVAVLAKEASEMERS